MSIQENSVSQELTAGATKLRVQIAILLQHGGTVVSAVNAAEKEFIAVLDNMTEPLLNILESKDFVDSLKRAFLIDSLLNSIWERIYEKENKLQTFKDENPYEIVDLNADIVSYQEALSGIVQQLDEKNSQKKDILNNLKLILKAGDAVFFNALKYLGRLNESDLSTKALRLHCI
jgi:hypothetical protein